MRKVNTEVNISTYVSNTSIWTIFNQQVQIVPKTEDLNKIGVNKRNPLRDFILVYLLTPGA